jgi:hypothetical protein
MNTLLDKRLAKLEQVHSPAPPPVLRQRQTFYVEGYGDGDVAEFLVACGHDVQDGDIIHTIVSPAPGGGPLVEPYVDITAEMRARRAR